MRASNRFKLLVVDDNRDIHRLIQRYFEKSSYDLLFADNGQQALDMLSGTPVDLMLLDLKMPGMDGLSVLEAAMEIQPALKVIMLTAHGGVREAVSAIKLGALDFFEKSIDTEILFNKVKQMYDMWRLELENQRLRNDLVSRFTFRDMLGQSHRMVELMDMIARIAPTDTSVLIQGESGTGKELIARAIHHHSQRAGAPFIPVDCAAMNETVVESELFGHTKGAFTGADKSTLGLFRTADTGTLFLDEVGELSLSMQAKLLRSIQERAVRPVGSPKATPVDIRILSASNKNLMEAVSVGSFRLDLYYRLSGITLEAPPLRQRDGDIAVLANHLIDRFSLEEGFDIKRFSSRALAALKNYHWPGNVRELENVVRRALVLTSGDTIDLEDLHNQLPCADRQTDNPAGVAISLPDHQAQIIRKTLEMTSGNRRETAKILKISEATLYRKIKQYNLTEV